MTIVSTIYSEAVANLESAKMSIVKETPMIQVIDDIRYPLKFNAKPIQKNITIGILLGLIIGLIVTILWYGLKNLNSIIKDLKPKMV